MSGYEVPEPIINSPYDEPRAFWHIVEGETPEKREGRRPAMYFFRDPSTRLDRDNARQAGVAVELKLVNRIRERVNSWREQGYPGATRTTLELLQWWRREGRKFRLFFAQLEAAESIIFLNESRADLRQGIDIPREETGNPDYAGFLRYACKMATGSGKTTVMGMLAAWSILNKVNDRSDKRFSDVVMIVCPNVTIRERLAELDPERGEASLYVTRDLVPPHLMSFLSRGRVLVNNWHLLELLGMQTGGIGAKVVKAGVPRQVIETITIGPKTTSARGSRYLTDEDLQRYVDSGLLTLLDHEEDEDGNLKKVKVESTRYVESDAAFVERILGREVGGKQNLLVMNDEAHHAYRIHRAEAEEDDEVDKEEIEESVRESTIWIEGLDRIHRQRGINFCLDLSATPYFLGGAAQETNRPFPWVVSDFGLTDAIESGLVKIPQLPVRDTTGAPIPAYWNIWQWILPQLTAAERGGRKANPKPEAILKYAHTPIAMLGGLWEKEREEWASGGDEERPPVFIIVCRNTQLAKVVYEWLALDKRTQEIPPAKIEGFRNTAGHDYTVRIDSKVVHETDTGEAKNDASQWMRFTLDTVGKLSWPADRQGRPLYPPGFEELAKKLDRPLDPPGREVRCIVSVGMLTEGWDCSTVTHIVGLRPFMSQLLCEQVVGRGLRRTNYDVADNGLFSEEVAKVFGVPFEIIPFKANKAGATAPAPKRFHVHALPGRADFEIRFPRVDGYTQAIRNRITVSWEDVPEMRLEPGKIPPEVQAKGLLPNNQGRPTLSGPGRLEDVDLKEWRSKRRLQELAFDLAKTLAKDFIGQGQCSVPMHELFPQLAAIVSLYVKEKVIAYSPADKKDLFLSPYYGWLVERILAAIRPDTSQGEAPEVPRYEGMRGPGSTAEVDFWTSRDVCEVMRSHVNYVVADTKRWEQSAAYLIDRNERVEAFVKNASLGFAIPYLHNGQMHDYVPDFIVRLKGDPKIHLILETKGYDPLEEVKKGAAKRWVDAVNADGRHGAWRYAIAKQPSECDGIIDRIAQSLRSSE